MTISILPCMKGYVILSSSMSNYSSSSKKKKKGNPTRKYFWVDKSLWTQWVATTMHCFQPV